MSAELFDVPVISHAHVVQRSPDRLSEAALRRVARRAKRVADARDPELERIAFAPPLVNQEQVVPGSRESRTTAITYLFFDPRTDLDDQEEPTARFAEKYVRFPDDHLVGITGRRPRGCRSGGRSSRVCRG